MSTPTTVSTRSAGRLARWAVVRTETRLLLREKGSLFWIVAFPALLLVALGLVPAFRRADPGLGGQSVLDLYVPVSVLLAMTVAMIQAMPGVLVAYRERGVLRRLSATPVEPGMLLGAQAVLHGAAALTGAVLAMAVGRLAFGTSLPAQPLGYVVAMALALLVFSSIGALITAVSRGVKVSTTLSTLVFFPTMFTSGVWLPVQAMPGPMRHLVLWSPAGAAANALNDAALGDWPRLVDLAVTAGWAAALGVLAVRLFRWE